MRWPTLAAATLLVGGLTGCDRIPWIGGGEEEAAVTDTAAVQQSAAPDSSATQAQAAADTTAEAEQPAATAQQAPAQPAPQARQPTVARRDEPWNPTHTGTINNGMTRAEVVAVWGEPAAERTQGEWLYLFYRNGCEVTCGTADVVMLNQGQVVDAIVRGVGHTYAGVSSSPPGSPAQFTPPGGAPGGVGMEG